MSPSRRRHGQNVSERGYVDLERPKLAWIRLVCEPELRRHLVEISRKDDVPLSETVRVACREFVKRRKKG